MLEYDPYYFRGQELYSFKPHLIVIEKKTGEENYA